MLTLRNVAVVVEAARIADGGGRPNNMDNGMDTLRHILRCSWDD